MPTSKPSSDKAPAQKTREPILAPIGSLDWNEEVEARAEREGEARRQAAKAAS